VFSARRAIGRYTRSNGTIITSQSNVVAPFTVRFGGSGFISGITGKTGNFNPVDHQNSRWYLADLGTDLKSTCNGTAISGGNTYVTAKCEGGFDSVCSAALPAFYSRCDSMALPTTSVNWSSLRSDALNAMLPRLSQGNSIINFVYELKDFKSLARTIADRGYSKVHKILAVIGFDRRDTTLKNLSNTYLQYNFAWRPLISDIISFVQAFTNLKARLEMYKARANQVQQSYYGTWVAGTDLLPSLTGVSEVVLLPAGPPTNVSDYWQPRADYYLSTSNSAGVRYHATVRYKYQWPGELDSFWGSIKGLGDVLGTTNLYSILWEATPWSFFIDYFVNIGRALNTVNNDNIQFKTQVLDFCDSVKVKRSCSLYGRLRDQFISGGVKTNLPHPWTLIAECQKSVYARRTSVPDVRSAVNVTGLNLHEFSIAGALVGSKLSKRKA
jgi:hypothetical protein